MARQFKVIVADDEKLIANNIARRIEESNGVFISFRVCMTLISGM